MIPDDLQDQAALYALGALDAGETSAFEAAMIGNAELRALVREMREASAALAHGVASQPPPAELRHRVLREIALEKQALPAGRSPTRPFNWLPWAIAALFLAFCGILALDRARLQRELATARAADPLSQATMVTLTSPTGDHPEARVTVAWQPDRQSGVIMINNMPPADHGRDYQLWAVDANHPDPIDAGIIHVEPNGTTRVRFKPSQNAAQIKAFAISLEREGGVPKREGPIVMIGNA
jgi:anti-sigma-K factor RskA